MKPLTWFGLGLILAGLTALVVPLITYTETETVVDIGPVDVTAESERTVRLPPVAGGMAVAAGVALVIASRCRA